MPPDVDLSFILETPDEGDLNISASNLEQVRFINTQHPINDPPGRTLVMFVEYDNVVSENGKAADFSLMIRKHEPDAALFSPSANGDFEIYTDPQDFIKLFLSPLPGSDERTFQITVDYDIYSMVAWGDASSVQIESTDTTTLPNGEILVHVSGRFAMPVAGWFLWPEPGEYATKDGQFRFTINLSEIY